MSTHVQKPARPQSIGFLAFRDECATVTLGAMGTGGDGLRCLIVDDSTVFRCAATKILESDGMRVVATATTAAEALDCIQLLRPDVVLLDIDLGAESGFDVAEALHRRARPMPALILVSTQSESDFADMISDSPALGFLPKIAFSATAIRTMIAGRDSR